MLLVFREIELPLHDNGMEPVEFLKSMGISLTPLNEAAGARSQKVRWTQFIGFKFCLFLFLFLKGTKTKSST